MSFTERSGKKWSINEVLKLQREYELLSLPINKIALNHKRTNGAIISKLEKEEFITHEQANELYNNLSNKNSDEVMNKIWNLETSLSNISQEVKELLSTHKMNSQNKITYKSFLS